MGIRQGFYAFEGGNPAFSREELSAVWPVYGDQEESALRRVLHSGRWCRLKDDHWASGETGQFEAEFKAYLGGAHFLSCANGTVAIELALRAIDVSSGDEVIVQAGTFFGTVTPVLRLGAVPVFVDLDEQSLGVDPAEVERAITPKTKAVIVVHLSGLSADMDAVTAVCARHRLPLIEDCAQSIGSRWKGQALGTFGDLGCFSFQQDKPLQAGEGGGVMCRDERTLGRLFALHQGFKVNGAPRFDRHEVGTNLRITPWQSAVLRVQLARLDAQIRLRRTNAELLWSELSDDSPLEPVVPLPQMTVWSIYSCPFRYRPEKVGGISRDEFLRIVRAEGLPAFEGHIDPLYRRPLFLENSLNYRSMGCPRTERIASHEYFALMQWFMLGPPTWMHRFVALVRRLQCQTSFLIVKTQAAECEHTTAATVEDETPAILGGRPIREDPIAPRVRVRAAARRRIFDLVEDGRFSDWYGGPISREFEDAYAAWHGVKHAIAVNSGTSALHLACEALGLGSRDEVIVPAGAYVSAASSLAQVGALPVVCDVESRTWTIDPEDVRKRITGRTKAIVAVHFWGAPCRMDDLQNLASEFRLKLVEDCAQAHGAYYSSARGLKRVGTLGDIACFSFAPRKHISTGQGGLVLTNSSEYASFIRQQCNKGKGEGWLDYLRPGYSYVMPELEAILGLDGLAQLDDEIARRRAAVAVYREILDGTGLQVAADSSWGTHVYFKVPILLPNEFANHRTFMRKALAAENVSARPPHPPLYRIPWVRDRMLDANVPCDPSGFAIAEKDFRRIVEVESGPCLPVDQAALSARAILKVWRHIQREPPR